MDLSVVYSIVCFTLWLCSFQFPVSVFEITICRFFLYLGSKQNLPHSFSVSWSHGVLKQNHWVIGLNIMSGIPRVGCVCVCVMGGRGGGREGIEVNSVSFKQ